MTPEQFCYWLQGRAELQPDVPLSYDEWKSVREHLATVFKKVTSPVFNPNTASPTRSPLQDAIGRAREAGRPANPWPHTAPVITCSAESSGLANAAVC